MVGRGKQGATGGNSAIHRIKEACIGRRKGQIGELWAEDTGVAKKQGGWGELGGQAI